MGNVVKMQHKAAANFYALVPAQQFRTSQMGSLGPAVHQLAFLPIKVSTD